MSPSSRTALQVAGALLLVAAVLWWMWRLPRGDEAPPFWGAWMALVSPWAGLFAVIVALLMWWMPAAADSLASVGLLALDPLAVGTGVLALWTQRGGDGRMSGLSASQRVGEDAESRGLQRLQAWVGIGLGMLAVAAGYAYVLTHKTPFTPVGV